MLNISQNSIRKHVDISGYESYIMTLAPERSKKIRRVFIGFVIVLFGFLFLPWTQNIRAKGFLTALKPEQRPQTIQTVIGGRIEKWYVQEGDYVDKGDTILFISEVKDDYFDPALLVRTQKQIEAKEQAAESYRENANAIENQIEALKLNNKLRLMQAENRVEQSLLKLQADSIQLEAVKVNFEIARVQFDRMQELFNEGLRSLTEFEARKQRFQADQANLISAQNTLLSTRNDYLNAVMELNTIDNDFRERLAKANSDRFKVLSDLYDTEATITKLQNQLSNFQIRFGLYYIIAPQSGYVIQAKQVGIGENIREGTEIVSIMPAVYDLAVEMYVDPIDLPLVRVDSKVRFIFDGWPAVVFSGWPQISNGTFGGKVFAMDRFISPNGKYRILVVPDPDDVPWPQALRLGSGAEGIALFQDVPVWYEIWRQLNGFPPNYYEEPQLNLWRK